MQELKRVFTNRTFLLGLVLILVINAVMFYNEQKENDYGRGCGNQLYPL